MKRRSKLVLLTGAAGLIGSHILRRLMREGADIIAVNDLSTVSGFLNIIELAVKRP